MTTTLPTPERHTLRALSPSRAADFTRCPLLFRFRAVDRLPERPSAAAARGTLVHAVLEALFEQPAHARTAEAAVALIEPRWAELVEQQPELADLVGTEAAAEESDGSPGLGSWLRGAERLVRRWFELEDPTRLEPASRELHIEAGLDDGPLLHGYVDRVDIAHDGAIRIVDYKTGRAPGVGFERRALFQLRFYALVLWRMHGTVPRMLQLVYLGDGQVLRYEPDEHDLRGLERVVRALWEAVDRALATGDFPPRRSAMCARCDFTKLCPEFGGTPPPLPALPAHPTPAG